MLKLLLNSTSGQPKELFLNSGAYRVGRNSANDIQIEHPSVSSFHCEVTCAGDAVIVKDLGSTNGTFIEKAPIQEACLAHGQRLQLGSVEMILEAQPSSAASPSVTLPTQPSTAQATPKPPLAVRLSQHATPPAITEAGSVEPASTPRPSAPKSPIQTDRAQAEQQARSKMLWGDPPEDVTKYLMMQGLVFEEASTLTAVLLRERVVMLRGIGTRKILIGLALMSVPVVSYFVMAAMGVVLYKLLGMAGAVGLFGAWMCLKGLFMVLAPKSEPGDVADK